MLKIRSYFRFFFFSEINITDIIIHFTGHLYITTPPPVIDCLFIIKLFFIILFFIFLGTPGDRHGILIGPGALATRASMAVSDTIQIPLNGSVARNVYAFLR